MRTASSTATGRTRSRRRCRRLSGGIRSALAAITGKKSSTSLRNPTRGGRSHSQAQLQRRRGVLPLRRAQSPRVGRISDFLLGIPDTSAVAFGNPDKYFRQPAYDLYVNDNFRMRPELTIEAGMRGEYGSPVTELYGRLVNLDIGPGFAAATPVVGNTPTGALTGTRYPASLVRPDRRGFRSE